VHQVIVITSIPWHWVGQREGHDLCDLARPGETPVTASQTQMESSHCCVKSLIRFIYLFISTD